MQSDAECCTVVQTDLEPGALVRHQCRPGVWRIVGLSRLHAAIEPHDDQAAAALDQTEAYTIVARLQALSRLRPGRSAPPSRARAAVIAGLGEW
jgi:hypothetical protein